MRRAGPFQYCDMHAVACMNNSMMKAHAWSSENSQAEVPWISEAIRLLPG
jgi:hypothetical protein